MTVKQLFYTKYLSLLKTMNKVSWENTKYYASARNQHIAQYMYMSLEVTDVDIKENGGYNGELWQEIKEMHKAKKLASNSHRGNSRGITKYWLTLKGFSELNKDHEIC